MKKEDLRIVFLGTPEFAVESLSRIVGEGYNVVGVVTMPDKIAGRGHKLIQSPVKDYALAHGLHLMQPERLKAPEFVEELRGLRANLFVVIAFRMLPEVVWSMPELGTFNLHASLLPRYRGAAPINRAVMNGDTETGVTTFFLKQAIDTGDVLRQERIDIGPDEDAGSVHDRLMMLGADVTLDTIAHIVAGDLTPVPQDKLLQGEEPSHRLDPHGRRAAQPRARPVAAPRRMDPALSSRSRPRGAAGVRHTPHRRAHFPARRHTAPRHTPHGRRHRRRTRARAAQRTGSRPQTHGRRRLPARSTPARGHTPRLNHTRGRHRVLICVKNY